MRSVTISKMMRPSLEPPVTQIPRAPLVVVLEDDRRAADALILLLADWGYDCVHGESFTEAMAALDDRYAQVRAIISDFHLADGTTGIEAAEKARQRGIAAPVLMLTGTLRGAARRSAGAAGHQFMEKPVEADRLKRWLRKVVVD